jgi:predicted ABC-type ATPase
MKNIIRHSRFTGYKGFDRIGRETSRNLREMKEVIEQDTQVLESEEKEYSLSGGKFFQEHPEKLLAEPYEGSSAYGPVTKYRPKAGKKAIEALEEIETPQFIAHGIVDISAGASVIISPELKPTEEGKNNLEGAIETSKKNILKRQKSEKRQIKEFEEPEVRPTIPFMDNLRNLNKNLSQDEIKAFLWYQHQIGNTYKGEWLSFFNPTLLSQEQESAHINNWVKNGILFYDNSHLLPAAIYFSDDIYARKLHFEEDKADIISIYGQEAYEKQKSMLDQAFNEVFNNRLKLDDPELDKRLHLKPYGELTDSIMVKNWNTDSRTGEPEKFKVITTSNGSINWYSKRTFLRWGDTQREELSINDAFRYWLKHDDKRPVVGHNFDYEDIFKYYLDKKAIRKVDDPTVIARNRALTKEIGDRLFSQFLAEIILEDDRNNIETIWNQKYNSNRGVNSDKIPVCFECALYYPENEPVEIKSEKREGVAFSMLTGSSLSAYGVGYGKTWVAILTIGAYLDAGHAKRPVIIVPNQVYKQFYSELRGLLPHRKLNDLYNLSQDYYEKLLDENGNIQPVEEGSISMLTYEGFEQIGFNEQTSIDLLDQLSDAITQIQEVDVSTKKGEKDIVRIMEKLKGIMGRALQKTRTNIEDLGFDFACFDEAHALKNIFAQVKARPKKPGQEGGDEEEEKGPRGKKMYEISGSTSTRGIKAYMLCSYIQLHNNGRNILLLTATPFTNSPLEVYSMLSLIAYQHLKSIGLANINDFFDNYCQMSYELVINSKLQPIRKQIFKAFDNLQSLQKLVYRYMLYKEAGKADKNGNIVTLVRPNKHVLPYTGYYDDKNVWIAAKPDEIIDTTIPLSDLQKSLMEEIIQYVEGDISYEALQARGVARLGENSDDSEAEKEKSEEILLDEGELDEKEKAGVRTLRGMNFARSLALSPFLYEFSGLGKPSYKEYILKSPKLKYIIDCISSVKKWHEDKGQAVSGQIIYMDRGKDYFELIKDYLVHEVGYKANEIGIIRSGGKEGGKDHKDNVKNGFNGLKFDDKTKTFSNLPDEERIKIVIGTSSIREGMNLQRFTACLYNAFVDWNPTDEIQLEGRCWRQGNTFSNVRIIIPMMADSMDIFMFQKLEEKTARINSIWNYDGQTNVLKVEELDPHEVKMKLVTNPLVLAKIESEDVETKINEEIAEVENAIKTANNITNLFELREELDKALSKILKIIDGKTYPSIEVMIKKYEDYLTKQSEDDNFKSSVRSKLRSSGINKYDYSGFIDYEFELDRPYSYGQMKQSVTSLKKFKRSFLDKFGVKDDPDSVKSFIKKQETKKERLREDIKKIKSEEYLNERAKEIERERQKQKIKLVPLGERVKDFEKLNYLLEARSDKSFFEAEKFIETEIEGCPPMAGDSPDISLTGIKKLEACLDRIPQTKTQHIDETGEYTERRKKLHKDIKARLIAGLHCKIERETPIAIFMAGVPGSGKTTWIKKYAPNLTKEKIFKIDADEIRAMLPEYKGWNSKATHKETQDIYKSLLKDISEGKPCRFDILWDGTMNKADNYLPLIGDLRKLGYEIFMIQVKVPWEVSRKRTLDRYVKAVERGEKGRYVPMEVVDEANKNGGKAFDELKYKADGYLVIDGMTGDKIEEGGRNLLADRGYFDSVPTQKDVKRKRAEAEAFAEMELIEILKLKAA